jgi:hypothetical protein
MNIALSNATQPFCCIWQCAVSRWRGRSNLGELTSTVQKQNFSYTYLQRRHPRPQFRTYIAQVSA